MEPYTLTKQSTADWKTIQTILGDAFVDYPLMRYAVEDDTARRTLTGILYGGLAWDALRHGEVWGMVPSGILGGLGFHAGFACWLRPGKEHSTLFRQLRAGLWRLPMQLPNEAVERLTFYGDLNARYHVQFAPNPHWYLSAIGVSKTARGQGFGWRVAEPILRRADEDGVDCFLDTHDERNVTIYERWGFQVAEKITPAEHPIPVWFMIRRPSR